jgi:curved DNA-binding protein CbpA
LPRSFYALSKTHHPDVNPSDPDAASNFSRISESYTVLSSATRRAAYDRDVLRLHHDRPGSGPAHHGSYHSTNPAGGRSPSGLSRRRGTFRGPPPSFYRSGGWGAHADKRRQAHEESTGGGGGGDSASPGQGPSSGRDDPAGRAYGQYGGMGPGADPFGHHDEVPHFDKEGHTRTHVRQDHRRSHRGKRSGDGIEFEPQMSIAGHFFVVSGILAATIFAPYLYTSITRSDRPKRPSV